MALASDPAEYTAHLTPERRQHFEFMGFAVVEADLFRHAYSEPEKRMAAMAWLSEIRRERERQETEARRRSVEAAERSAAASEVAAQASGRSAAASEHSARWTMWAAIIALVTTLASVLGAFLVWLLR